MTTSLSVNINKIATLRNARGENNPDLLKVALDCERFGADGITVHPRPDERHIRRADVYQLRPALKSEFNIEGYPSNEFMDLVLKVKPAQVTLVPDSPDALTSSAGWKVSEHFDFLTSIVNSLHEAGIRSSIFVSTDIDEIMLAAKTGTDRVELYTKPYVRSILHQSRKGRGALRRGITRSPQGRTRCQCRSRPQPAKPALFRAVGAVSQRSVDRPCPHLRRALYGSRRDDTQLQGLPDEVTT